MKVESLITIVRWGQFRGQWMNKFTKDFLVKIIAEPALGYLLMFWWNWYANGRGFLEKLAYRAKVEEFLAGSGFFGGFKEFCYNIACNPIDFAWVVVAISLILGVTTLMGKSNEGEYD